MKRKRFSLSRSKRSELHRTREKIMREEKEEIASKGRVIRRRHETAMAELVRVADLLRAERLAQGLSLADMQQRTGIPRSSLCRVETLVDANPTISTLDRIAQAMGKQLIVGLRDKG